MKRQSSLLPYKNEIVTLRRQNPPMPYAQIAELLHEKYQIEINREAIFKFIKACATTHKESKKKNYKPCTYAHKIKLSGDIQPTPVEVNSQPELSEQKIDIVLEPCLTIKQTSTLSVPLENKDSEQIDRERLTDVKAKAESPLQKAKEKREAERAEREAQRQREREEREAQYAKRENERAKEQQMDEKARFAPENFIVDDPDFVLPNDLIEKLHDMKCKFDIKTQRFYHTDMAIVSQARRLVREHLN